METTHRTPFPYTWEQAVTILYQDPEHRQLMFDSYLTPNLNENCRRFADSEEFLAVRTLLAKYANNARRVLDIPGGNGIAAHAFAESGFDVTTVEPDGSDLVGRGAIRHVLAVASLEARIIGAYGESLPLADAQFDIVYVRQGLHHARDLEQMLREYHRVLKPGGVLVACREPVVDDHGASLQVFLDTQVDHQLYGGENAFTLSEYTSSICKANFSLRLVLEPYASPINLHPNTPETLNCKILASKPGRALGRVLPARLVTRLGLWYLRHARRPGRLYSFLGIKRG